ncbi:MAG: hypothetical protein LBF75_04445 [Treponema sp.]|jgi:hypothetical protein|nr:hypothetical protein [Treponema sp.]
MFTMSNQDVPGVRQETVEVEDGDNLALPERFESSRTDSNLVHNLWFGCTVTLTLLAEDGPGSLKSSLPRIRASSTRPAVRLFGTPNSDRDPDLF